MNKFFFKFHLILIERVALYCYWIISGGFLLRLLLRLDTSGWLFVSSSSGLCHKGRGERPEFIQFICQWQLNESRRWISGAWGIEIIPLISFIISRQWRGENFVFVFSLFHFISFRLVSYFYLFFFCVFGILFYFYFYFFWWGFEMIFNGISTAWRGASHR